MHLLEYQAKKIISKNGVRTPKGELVEEESVFSEPVILKIQVPTGKRGKAGGVVKVTTKAEFDEAVLKLRELEVDGYKAEAVLAEEVAEFDNEHYFSILLDRPAASIRIVARKQGGVDVEDSDERVFSELVPYSTELDSESGTELTDLAEQLRAYYGYDESFSVEFDQFLKNSLRAFKSSDSLLLEVNPLVMVDQKLTALDCKIELDDNALYRQEDFLEKQQSSNFVLLDEYGDTAIIANGAGLAMATVDQVNSAGLKATNFLDVGGGADAEAIAEQFAELSKLPNLKRIVVNIFAGITKCDQVAEAIVEARGSIDNLPPLYIRLHGNRFDEAKNILDEAGISLYGSLKECIEAVNV